MWGWTLNGSVDKLQIQSLCVKWWYSVWISAENMAEFRMGGIIGIQKDKLGSPSTGSEDGGGVDLAELVQELDHDEFDGPTVLNGTWNTFFTKNM